MLFVATIREKTGSIREFSFGTDLLEDGLDLLSRLASWGGPLLKAYIIDKDSLMKLPESIFDGDDFSPRIQPLQVEWQAILDRPLPGSTADKDWYQARLTACQDQIVRQELLMSSLRQLLEKVPRLRATEGHKQSLIRRYQTILATCEAQLERIARRRRRLNAQLRQLQKGNRR